jgi:phage antirepressor YoqD-like protein
MNEIDIFGNGQKKTMTAREVAEALGYQQDTIQKVARALEAEGKIARIEIRADSSHAILLGDEQVQAIKDVLVPRSLASKNKIESAITPIDIERMTLQVIQYHAERVKELEAELAIAAPKVESFNALMRSDRNMSITDAAKHFGLHPKLEVFPYLRARGYLTLSDLPTQAAIDTGYLSLKEVKAQDGRVWPQAVVEAWQLENWRAHVVHQIKSWVSMERAK